MRIISLEYEPSTKRGGQERSLFTVLVSLKKLGHDITIAYVKDGDLVELYRDNGIEMIQVPSIYIFRKLSVREWVNFFSSLYSIKDVKNATIYINQIMDTSFAVALKMLRGAGKIVCHLRLPPLGYNLRRPINQLGIFARFISLFIVASAKLKKQHFASGIPEKKILIIPNAFDFTSLTLAKQVKSNFIHHLAYIGRFHETKGLDTLIDGMIELQRRGFEFNLDIAGIPFDINEKILIQTLKEKILQNNLHKNINFVGHIFDPSKFLSSYHLCIFPSKWDEPFGRVLVESLAAGTAVIASDVGIISEIIDDPTGEWLFNNSIELADKVQKFFADPDAYQLNRRIEYVTRKYNIENLKYQVECALINNNKNSVLLSKFSSVLGKLNLYLNPSNWKFFFIRREIMEFDIIIRMQLGMQWLVKGQKKSGSKGIAYGYRLEYGWLKAYPETNGYIISTLLDYYLITEELECLSFAIELGDWEISIQKADGSVRVGFPESEISDIFDTGMVLEGFVRLYLVTGFERFIMAAKNAVNWLVKFMNLEGAWDLFTFQNIPHSYHTLVAQAILRLYKICPDEKYLMAVDKNIAWVLSQKQTNGWFKYQGFSKDEDPYTHTMAYFVQGLLEIFKENYQNRFDYLLPEIEEYCLRLIRQFSLDKVLNTDLLLLPGQIKSDWTSNYNYVCLTGNAQFSCIFFDLYKITGNPKYLNAANNLLNIVASCQLVSAKNSKILGAIAGSYPLNGAYHPYEFPNWPVKFFIDALMKKLSLNHHISYTTPLSNIYSAV